MNYTTIEQSKKLLELGLNSDTADLLYECFKDEVYGDVTYSVDFVCNRQSSYPDQSIFEDVNTFIPCWSLGALINLMPYMIYKDGETFTLRVHKDAVYHVCYKSHYHLDEIWFSKENLLDAAFEMVCWLLENGYIKTEKK